MKWTRSLSPLLVLSIVSLLTTGVATAQDAAPEADVGRPTRTITFYGHVFGHGLDAPMPTNTQFPKGEDNYGLGSFAWCTPAAALAGLPPTDARPGDNCDTDPNNKLVLFSTAGFVQVSSGSEFTGGGGYAQLHNERGGAKDIVLDAAESVKARIHLSMDVHAWSVGGGAPDTYCPYPNPKDTGCVYPYWGWDPAFIPQFTVKACLMYAVLGEYGSAAADMPPVREAMEAGQATQVACGATAPADIANGLPGQPNVHAFDIDLGAPQVTSIPKEANFFLVYSFMSNLGGNEASLHTWRIWSGEFYPPAFTLPVKNAFDVELVVPQFLYGKLAILGLISTPWGSYDVDPSATKLTIKDARGNELAPQHIEALADYKVAHGAHYKPVNVTFVWDYLADRLPAGTYTATVSARNNQGSASAECTAEFTLLPGGQPGSIKVGQCGQQTDAQKKAAVGDASSSASGSTNNRHLAVGLGERGISLASSETREVPLGSALAIVALAIVARLSLGRWK